MSSADSAWLAKRLTKPSANKAGDKQLEWSIRLTLYYLGAWPKEISLPFTIGPIGLLRFGEPVGGTALLGVTDKEGGLLKRGIVLRHGAPVFGANKLQPQHAPAGSEREPFTCPSGHQDAARLRAIYSSSRCTPYFLSATDHNRGHDAFARFEGCQSRNRPLATLCFFPGGLVDQSCWAALSVQFQCS